MEISMIERASGRALVNKTLETARNFIAIIVVNTQHLGTHSNLPKKVNKLGVLNHIEQKMSTLTSIVQLAIKLVQAYGICTNIGYIDICATI